jgi:hypothetical protein
MNKKQRRRAVCFGQSERAMDRMGALNRNFDHLHRLRLRAGENRVEEHRGQRQCNESLNKGATLRIRHDDWRHVPVGAASVKIAHG